jgi:hypothetical protein
MAIISHVRARGPQKRKILRFESLPGKSVFMRMAKIEINYRGKPATGDEDFSLSEGQPVQAK